MTTTAIIQVNLHQPAPPVKNWRILVGAKFYCPHALADGNQRIRIREITLHRGMFESFEH